MSMPARSRLVTRAATAIAAAALTLLAAGVLAAIPGQSASAHDYLVSSSPAAGSTISEPIASVSLSFNDLVLDFNKDGSSAIVQVTGPDADTRHFETGCAAISSRTITAPVALGASGQYTITWRMVSADGHPVSNQITFNYLAPATSTPAPGLPAGTACAAADSALDSTAASPADSGVATPEDPTGLIIGVGVTVVVLALGAVAWIALAARRRDRRAADDDGPSD
jgi:hypothetical protein